MERHKIVFNDIEYIVGEPTIKDWKKMSLTKDTMDDRDFALELISSQTGLSKATLLECDWYDIFNVAEGIIQYFNQVDTRHHDTFEFKGETYKFVDLENITFGEFVDMDTYLQKAEIEKLQRLNYYMALLYRPIGEDYDIKKLKERAELFNDLPVKYYFGANKVFFSLSKMLAKNTRVYFYLMMLKYWTRRIIMVLVAFGVGIVLYLPWQVMMWLKSTRLPKYLSHSLSTIYHTLKIYKQKGINNLKRCIKNNGKI